jgi:hypothetical protein
VPVTNVDELLRTPNIRQLSDTATNISQEYAVPSGKRWLLRGISAQRIEAGIIRFYIDKPEEAGSIQINEGVITGTDLYSFFPPLIVDATWIVRVTFSTGLEGTLTSAIIYDEEDAY